MRNVNRRRSADVLARLLEDGSRRESGDGGNGSFRVRAGKLLGIGGSDDRITLRKPAPRPLFHCVFSRSVVASVDFFTHHGEICSGCRKGIGFPRKSNRRHFYLRLELAGRLRTLESELPRGVLIKHRFAGRFPGHLERHPGWRGECIQSRPARLIHHWHIFHLERDRVPVWSDIQTSRRYSDNPVKSRGRNRRMKIVNLVSRDRRSPK